MGVTRNNNRAFTLIEMAVVIGITAIIISFAISVGTAQIEAQKTTITKQRIQFITERISNYARLYRHLPCPADPDLAPNLALSGIGQGTNDSTSPTCVATLQAGSGITNGAVPYKTLGISEAATIDGWGNRIRYVVDEDLVYTGDTWVAGSVQTGYANHGNPTMYTSATSPANDRPVLGNITLEDAGGTTLRNDVAFAVLSHGANGLGAYPADGGSANATTGATGDELSNSTSLTNAVVWSPTIVGGFDDLLLYRTKWQIEGF